jgi:hypothetical protein
MLDLVGAITGTASAAVVVGALVGFSSARLSTKLAVFTAAAVWAAMIVAIAALGISASAVGPVPVPVVAAAVLLGLLFGSWRAFPRFREALLSVPLPALIGVHAARAAGVGGLYFVILTAQGRMSAPFGPAAGWGDVLVGALAIPVAAIAATGVSGRRWVGAWNVLGALDLIDALVLGALSAPGTPIRVFTDGPGTLALGTLPWIMAPAMLVPLYLLIHLMIAVKIGSAQRVPHAVPARSAA